MLHSLALHLTKSCKEFPITSFYSWTFRELAQRSPPTWLWLRYRKVRFMTVESVRFPSDWLYILGYVGYHLHPYTVVWAHDAHGNRQRRDRWSRCSANCYKWQQNWKSTQWTSVSAMEGPIFRFAAMNFQHSINRGHNDLGFSAVHISIVGKIWLWYSTIPLPLRMSSPFPQNYRE